MHIVHCPLNLDEEREARELGQGIPNSRAPQTVCFENVRNRQALELRVPSVRYGRR